jgi:hypothetical protein
MKSKLMNQLHSTSKREGGAFPTCRCTTLESGNVVAVVCDKAMEKKKCSYIFFWNHELNFKNHSDQYGCEQKPNKCTILLLGEGKC